MRTLSVFNQISLDGYFTDQDGDMSWAHRDDPEWAAFSSANARGGGTLLFGRVTYDLMVRFWPTPAAAEQMPEVAAQMNALPKVVFSRTLGEATWENTEVAQGDLAEIVGTMKAEPGSDMVIMGSGTIIVPLTEAGLIDTYQLVVVPIVLGAGRTLFEGVREKVALELTDSRTFTNGNVVLSYRPAG